MYFSECYLMICEGGICDGLVVASSCVRTLFHLCFLGCILYVV
jgi:hypothetical protein